MLRQMTKNRAGNSDGFTERGINTFNDLPKHKNMQTDRISHRDASTLASVWDLYDTNIAAQGMTSPRTPPTAGRERASREMTTFLCLSVGQS